MENRQQSAENNISKSNQEQAKQILDDLHEQFNEQNAMLEYQNHLLEQILKIQAYEQSDRYGTSQLIKTDSERFTSGSCRCKEKIY